MKVENQYKIVMEVSQSELELFNRAVERAKPAYSFLGRAEVIPLRAKLTPEIVVEIRKRYAEGHITQRDLAAEYGIDSGTISRITQGKIWPELGGPITDGRPRQVKDWYERNE